MKAGTQVVATEQVLRPTFMNNKKLMFVVCISIYNGRSCALSMFRSLDGCTLLLCICSDLRLQVGTQPLCWMMNVYT